MNKPRYRVTTKGKVTALDGFALSVMDGYSNSLSALGSFNAKTSAGEYIQANFGSNGTILQSVYESSTWYSKILEIPADDATREWRSWKGTKEQIEALEKVEKDLQLVAKVRELLIMARHRGGAVMVMGGLPGIVSSPLNIERVQKGDLKFLNVVSRDEINPEGLIRDPFSPFYGQPEYWVMNSDMGQKKIHPSRVVFMQGRQAPGKVHVTGDVWGSSLWDQMSDSVGAADSGASIVTALLHEAVVDVVKVPNFIQGLVSEDAEELHNKRWAMAKRLKSVGNMLLLDAADEWEQKQVTWTGLPEVIQLLLTIMAGASDIPVTRLIGRSASGMNATGEGDLRNHYDNIKAMQKLKLSPAISILDQVLQRSALGSEVDGLWYMWKPLWQPSEKDMAETDRLEANATAILSKLNLVPTKAMEKVVQNRMIESGRYPGLEEALIEFPEVEPPVVEPPAVENPTGVQNERANRLSSATNVVDAAPRTLYVNRPVMNSFEIVRWAKDNGFTDIIPDLHVTLLHSKTPVDWFKMGEPWQSEMVIPAGGARLVEQLGENGAYYVLLISSSELAYRNAEFLERGASSDHEEYTAHISIQKGGFVDLSKVIPYRGQIVLGPEHFEEIKR